MTGYEPEKQKEYNKKYYETNKLKIAEQIGKKEECEHCGRMVRHDNMTKHMKTEYCKNKRHMELHPIKEEVVGGEIKEDVKEELSDSDSDSDFDFDSDSEDSYDSIDEIVPPKKKYNCKSKDKEYVKAYNKIYYQK